MGKPQVKHLIDLYKLQLQAKAYRDHVINYRHFDELNLDSCIIVVFADSSFGNIDDEELQDMPDDMQQA